MPSYIERIKECKVHNIYIYIYIYIYTKVVGSLRNEVVGSFLSGLNPYSHAMALGPPLPLARFQELISVRGHSVALGSTKPLTEMSSRNLARGKGGLTDA
jgi:hypothetical protein